MTSYRKYKNIPTEVDGIIFHSKLEAKRYGELKLLQKEGEIKDLECQPIIPLMVNGKNIGKYIGDFMYYDNKFKKVILEDCKSKITKTTLYGLKKKILMTYDPPLEIQEIF